MSDDVEFNNGFVTALALFYGHRNQFERAQKIVKHDMRLYPAADHLFDMEYPQNLNQNLKRRIKRFVTAVFKMRLENISTVKANKFFDRCYELLMEIDRKHFDLDVTVNYP